jgi:branched-chain amino acid transport system permease protein
MEFSFFITQAISGLTMATLLFLVASGLTLIFGVGGVFNFAHGSFYMIGAYLGYQAVSVWQINFWLALVIAAVGAGIMGIIVEFLLLRRIYGRTNEGGFQILLTYCLILLIDDSVKFIWGSEYKSIPRPDGFSGAVIIGDIFVPAYSLLIIAIGFVIVIASWWILTRTRPGKIVRATAVDREMLGALGINVPVSVPQKSEKFSVFRVTLSSRFQFDNCSTQSIISWR